MPEQHERGSANFPDWYPKWASTFAELYFSGTTSMFTLHGNTHDLVRSKGEKFIPLTHFLAQELFGQWDIVLYYDLSTGLRVMGGSDSQRQMKMTQTFAKWVGQYEKIGKDPSVILNLLDKFIQKNVMVEEKSRLSVAVILGHASFLAHRGDRSLKAGTHIVTLLNWATSPYVKRLNTAFVLVDSALSDMAERIVGNPHAASIEIPLPDATTRHAYLEQLVGDDRDVSSFSDYSISSIADLTAGIGLTDLRVLVQGSIEGGRRLDEGRFRELKKMLIERQAQGMLEFIEPKWGIDMVVGHEAAKNRLKEDAKLLKLGKLQSVPMGYLFCGPVGTGKSFLAVCAAGTMGIPLVKLKNFRGGLVGETEGNLERVLGVLRSMGPVVVVVDEADAQLGDRKSGGDSGVSGRVFGMIAEQMGDTRYRGKILWLLLTARPDYLPIDLKRQGRAEVHMPLFYPTSDTELRDMFVVLAKKLDTTLDPEGVPEIPEEKRGQLSGADIEGILGRAWRKSLLAGYDCIQTMDLKEALDQFIPMAQSLEREVQVLAAIIECTDQEFLPEAIEERIVAYGGRTKVQERLNALKAVVDGN